MSNFRKNISIQLAAPMQNVNKAEQLALSH